MKKQIMITVAIIVVAVAVLLIAFFAFLSDEKEPTGPVAPDGTAFEVPTEPPPGSSGNVQAEDGGDVFPPLE